jgi:hypothetical protein
MGGEGQPARQEELGMTKRKKVLPARKPRDRSRDDDSLLLRSAESLGRVIGALQRQLDGATKRLMKADGAVVERIEKKVRQTKGILAARKRKPRSRKQAAGKTTKRGTSKTAKKR